uniref:Cyclin-H n=1 Tax=Clastoptera arizonana TaxID=38151 RepID=A0A1B6DCS3_9HEMI
MYETSTQKRYWTFSDENELKIKREAANQRYVEKNKDIEDWKDKLLTPSEERTLLSVYGLNLREFCKRFTPPMPKAVVGTAFHYFKRFYVNNTVMDYHPKEILVTAAYLACKVEEFNVSINQFVANIQGDRDKCAEIILNSELLIMEKMNFHLTVHNPYRPIEGLLIDLKTRSGLVQPERLRASIEDLVDKLFLTDACLLYAPSLLALAAVIHSASKLQENVDSYVTDTLLGPANQKKLPRVIEAVRNIRSLVKSIEFPKKEYVKALEARLLVCRNQVNNPDSSIYRDRILKSLNEEDIGRPYIRELDKSSLTMLEMSSA